jgi:hypothetical protein
MASHGIKGFLAKVESMMVGKLCSTCDFKNLRNNPAVGHQAQGAD